MTEQPRTIFGILEAMYLLVASVEQAESCNWPPDTQLSKSTSLAIGARHSGSDTRASPANLEVVMVGLSSPPARSCRIPCTSGNEEQTPPKIVRCYQRKACTLPVVTRCREMSGSVTERLGCLCKQSLENSSADRDEVAHRLHEEGLTQHPSSSL